MPWAFPFSHNKFSINRNVETFYLVSNVEWLKIKIENKKKKGDNYHDTDTAFYVLENAMVLTETLVRVCRSVLMSSLPMAMDWPKTLAQAMRKMKQRWSEHEGQLVSQWPNHNIIQEFCPVSLVFKGWTLSHVALEGSNWRHQLFVTTEAEQ